MPRGARCSPAPPNCHATRDSQPWPRPGDAAAQPLKGHKRPSVLLWVDTEHVHPLNLCQEGGPLMGWTWDPRTLTSLETLHSPHLTSPHLTSTSTSTSTSPHLTTSPHLHLTSRPPRRNARVRRGSAVDPAMHCPPPPAHEPAQTPAARLHRPSPRESATPPLSQHPETSAYFVALWKRGAARALPPCALPRESVPTNFPVGTC